MNANTDHPISIESIRVVTEPDDMADFSYLGEFTDAPGPDDRTIDRQARGTQARGEHRYFVAAHSPETTGNPASVEQDWHRAEAYGDEWHMVGIRAVATLTIRGVRQTLTSGGLFGVESDADDSYLQEVALEELADLRDTLAALDVDAEGVTPEWDSQLGPSGPVVHNLDLDL